MSGTNGTSVSADESPRMNTLLEKLTIDEKISLLAAKNVWETQEIERLNIPSLKVYFRYSKVASFPTHH
jgi:beta-glucosidase